MPPRKRLFIDFSACISGSASSACTLSAEDSHYLRDVLRAKPGDEVILLDKRGKNGSIAYLGRVQAVKEKMTLDIFDQFEAKAEEAPVHTLIFGLCKGEKNELAVQKATELGVRSIILWQTARSVVRIRKEGGNSRIERLMKISESAAEQSGQSSLPEIRFCISLHEVLEAVSMPPGARLISCSLSPHARPLHDLIVDRSPIAVAVGPEGDLTPGEEAGLVDAGFGLVNLGPSVLRSETAAIAVIAMAQALWRTKS